MTGIKQKAILAALDQKAMTYGELRDEIGDSNFRNSFDGLLRRGYIQQSVTGRFRTPRTPVEAEADLLQQIEMLKAREARFIAYCDSLHTALARITEHHEKAGTTSVIVGITHDDPNIQFAMIFNPDLAWYRITRDGILERWYQGRISEGLAASLLGVDRIPARMLMEQKYGMNWRDGSDG